MSLPLNTLGSQDEEVLVGYLGPKSNPATKTISWTTKPPSSAGRQRLCDIVKGHPATLRYSDHIIDIRSSFESMFDREMIIVLPNFHIKMGIREKKS